MNTSILSKQIALFFGKPKILYLILVVILFLGVVLEYFNPCWEVSALSRSGSVLVAFSIYLVFLNHVMSGAVESGNSTLNKLSSARQQHALNRQKYAGFSKNFEDKYRSSSIPPNIQMKLDEYLDKLNKVEEKATIEEMELMAEEFQQDLGIYSSVSLTLGRAEVTIGITGTLIWGFGDLLFKIF